MSESVRWIRTFHVIESEGGKGLMSRTPEDEEEHVPPDDEEEEPEKSGEAEPPEPEDKPA